MVDAVRTLPFVVTKVEKRNRRKNPAAPFTTSTIQQEAAKKLGFSSRRTMRAAQDLYEGMDVGEDGPVGLITYMRTDSVRVSDAAIASVREFIGKNYAKPYLPGSPNAYSSRKNARVQDAHEAIRPTDVSRRPEQVQKYLEPDQFRLYQLIWQRFVASQMTPAVYDMTIVDFDLGRYLFRATGSVLVFDGYHVLYMEGREKEEGKTMDDLPPIPPLARGDEVEVREITPSQHFTEPPPRFSEASLVKELERLGIGRPSTYSAIISTLSAREYVKVEQRRFFPTELGELVEKIMVGKFPEIFNVEFTSEMETELDRIEDGELLWQGVLRGLLHPVQQGARGSGSQRPCGRRARAQARGAGQGAVSQVRLADRAQDRAVRALSRLRQVQGHLRLREVAPEGPGARPADRREVPPLQLADGHQDRPLRRVPRVHHVPRVQGHPRHPPRHQVPEVHRGRPRRAPHQAGQVVLGLRALPCL